MAWTDAKSAKALSIYSFKLPQGNSQYTYTVRIISPNCSMYTMYPHSPHSEIDWEIGICLVGRFVASTVSKDTWKSLASVASVTAIGSSLPIPWCPFLPHLPRLLHPYPLVDAEHRSKPYKLYKRFPTLYFYLFYWFYHTLYFPYLHLIHHKQIAIIANADVPLVWILNFLLL